MTEPGGTALGEALRAYRAARQTEDRHSLVSRRRSLLPMLRGGADGLSGREELEAALAVLDDRAASAMGPVPEEDVSLRGLLAARLEPLRGDRYSVPVLLIDPATDEARVDRLIVELLDSPGRGRVWTTQAVHPTTEASARHAVVAAVALLRRRGWQAEVADLEVIWQLESAEAELAGPSLGLALALAVLARGTQRALPADLAATGAVQVDGRVAPVAGIAAKARAAGAAGLKRVLVPAGSGGGADEQRSGADGQRSGADGQRGGADEQRGGADGPQGSGAAASAGGSTVTLLPVATLDEAASAALGIGLPDRPSRESLGQAAVAALVLLLGLVGALNVPAVLGYSSVFQPTPSSLISDRVVLVTWDRSNGSTEEPPEGSPVDFREFADHRSYRATHPQVLSRLAGAGAAVVGADVWIRGGDQEATAGIVAAVQEARAAGTEVVLPARRDADRWDDPDPALVDAVSAVGFASSLREGPLGLERAARLAWARPPADAPLWSVTLLMLALRDGGELPTWTGPVLLRAGEHRVPAPEGVALVPFPAAPDYRRYSYADIYFDRFDPAHVDGALVLLGAAQGDQDRHNTPVGDWYGIEVQAALLDAMLGGRSLTAVGTLGRLAASGLLAALLVGALARKRRQWPTGRWLALGAAAVAGCWLASWLAMGAGRYWPWTDGALLVGALAFAGLWVDRRRGRSLTGAG